jgi:hypothetical protein
MILQDSSGIPEKDAMRQEETMRQLSETLARQRKELATRLDTIRAKSVASSEADDATPRHGETMTLHPDALPSALR